MRKDFNFARRETPILEDPRKSKNGIYEIRDNFLSFWYYFVDKRRDYIEQKRFPELLSQFNRDFPAFVGRKFEKFIVDLIKAGIIPIEEKFEKIGRQWGKIAANPMNVNGGQVYEIDILMENPGERKLLLGECQWKEGKMLFPRYTGSTLGILPQLIVVLNKIRKKNIQNFLTNSLKCCNFILTDSILTAWNRLHRKKKRR